MTPCIIQQLRCHVEATRHYLLALDFAYAGKRRQALKEQAEAKRWERLYREYGGTGPITYLMRQTHTDARR